MKILIFIHSLSSGGAERVSVNLANFWADNGHDLVIVTMSGSGHKFYPINRRIQHIALGLDEQSKSVMHGLFNNAKRTWKLRKILKKQAPDVAIAMMSTANCILAWAGYRIGVPLIGSERVYPPMWPLGKIWEYIRHKSYPHLNAIVAQTELTGQWLAKYSRAKKITIIPNPVNFPLVNHSPEVPVGLVTKKCPDSNIMLSVGRLEQQKGYDRLLEVFARMYRTYPDWILVILGEGSQREILTNLAYKYRIEDKVFLPGTVGNVGEWLSVAKLFVLTSRFEGFPNTLLEALAYGIPSVAVDCKTGPRDILRHEVDGLLVRENDDILLEEALSRLMGDQDLRKTYSKRAVEVRERYALKNVANMWEKLFVEVMSG